MRAKCIPLQSPATPLTPHVSAKRGCRLQGIVLPDIPSVAVPELYVRGPIQFTPGNRSLTISPMGTVRTDTYFNAFGVRYWAEKTAINSVTASIAIARGSGTIRFFHKSAVHDVPLGEPVCFDDTEAKTFDAQFLIQNLRDGFVYWIVAAERETVVLDAVYTTEDIPLRSVTLGVIVTTFRRENEVRDTIQRFSRSTLPGDGHRLLVVDNGGSLETGTFDGGEIIANRNLGGAGGFARGLIELRQREGFTHALFMDDDALTHLDSISRTITILSYARSETMAVSGSMLVREAPWILFEAGGEMKRFGVRPIKHRIDLRPAASLLSIDVPVRVDYGAWWFFAFSLSQVKQLSFPFFVRGDDIHFSIAHGFDIITPNGVAIWQDDFYDRFTPTTEYLAHRSDLLIALLRSSGSVFSRLGLARRATRAVRADAAAYRYSVAAARVEAIADVLKGPDFWRENPSAETRLEQLKSRYREDYVRKESGAPTSSLSDSRRRNSEGPARRLIRLATFNGHLLPRFLLKETSDWIEGLISQPAKTFGYSRVTYAARFYNRAVIANRSTRDFFRIRIALIYLRARMIVEFGRLRRDYEEAMPALVSNDYWRSALKLPPLSSSAKPTAPGILACNPAALGPKRVPDFVGIGSEKCGTTWLWNYFRHHPDVGVPAVKELRFFSQQYFGSPARKTLTELLDKTEMRPRKREWLDQLNCELRIIYGGLDGYLAIFGAMKEAAVGEITPSYCALPLEGIRQMRELNPAMKLIFLLRDPVDRAISGARMKVVERGLELSDATVASFAMDPFQIRLSRYADALARFEAVFPANQIYIGFFEDIAIRPEELLRDLCGFIGVEPKIQGMPVADIVNPGVSYEPSVELRGEIRSLLELEYDLLAKRFPDRIAGW